MRHPITTEHRHTDSGDSYFVILVDGKFVGRIPDSRSHDLFCAALASLTPSEESESMECGAISHNGYGCTLRKGHSGDHAAFGPTGTEPKYVWKQGAA